jgi:hypothetical protein
MKRGRCRLAEILLGRRSTFRADDLTPLQRIAGLLRALADEIDTWCARAAR